MADSIHRADRFMRGDFNFRRTDGGAVETVPLYSYESHGKLYDLLVLDGQELVRVNMGAWSNRIDAWERAHYAIRAHYRIGN